jgi:hypothetical protein
MWLEPLPLQFKALWYRFGDPPTWWHPGSLLLSGKFTEPLCSTLVTLFILCEVNHACQWPGLWLAYGSLISLLNLLCNIYLFEGSKCFGSEANYLINTLAISPFHLPSLYRLSLFVFLFTQHLSLCVLYCPWACCICSLLQGSLHKL